MSEHVPFVMRWLDVLEWALRLERGIITQRRAVMRGLEMIIGDLERLPAPAPEDNVTLLDARTLHLLVRDATDNEWLTTVRELRGLVDEQQLPTKSTLWSETPPLPPLVATPVLTLVTPLDPSRAPVEARTHDGRITYVWVESGDQVRHRSLREALDERWPQEARIDHVDGVDLTVKLLNRHGTSLEIEDIWRVNEVVLSSREHLDAFERASPTDLLPFGLQLAQEPPAKLG